MHNMQGCMQKLLVSQLKKNLMEFLIHGAKYAFPVEIGGKTRGIVTSYAAPVLKKILEFDDESLPPVWPFADGNALGLAFSPLYKSVPMAAVEDPELYELLCLVDAIRSGKTREQRLAAEILQNRLTTKD